MVEHAVYSVLSLVLIECKYITWNVNIETKTIFCGIVNWIIYFKVANQLNIIKCMNIKLLKQTDLYSRCV